MVERVAVGDDIFPASTDGGRSGKDAGRPAVVAFAFLDFQGGGAQRLTLETCRLLDPARFAPVLVCARGGGVLLPQARAAGVAVRELGRLRSPWDVAAPRRIARELRSLAVDVLHVPLYSRASPYFRWAGRRAGTPVVVAHEWSRPERPRWSRRLADRLLERGTRYVAASHAQARELVAAGARRADVEVVHAGIDVERFASGDRARGRATLGIPPETVLALVPARLHPAKGHRDLIGEMNAIAAAQPALRWAFVGDGPLREELAGALREAGLAGRVHLAGWRDDMPDLYAAADLVVLPSRVEGLPAALLEGFAASRPAVATDVGGVGEALRDGVEGRLVRAGDRAAFGRAVVELSSSESLRRETGERARRRVAEGFGARAATRRLEAVYERWLASAHAGRAA